MKRLVLGLVALALVAGTAWAHGGNYRGPGGEVPPNMRKPEDPPPPSDGGTPTPPPEEDPGGTPTPPDGPGGGGRPDAPPPPSGGNEDGPGKVLPPAAGGGGAGGGTATPGGGKRVGPPPVTFDSWEFWWGYNKDDLLNLKARLLESEGGPITRGGPIGVGKDHRRGVGASAAPTVIAIQNEVIPALEAILDDGKLHFDIRAAAVIALGKIGASFPTFETRIAKRLVDIMNIKSGEEHFSVEESGALALGLLGSKDSAILNALCDKALDSRGAFTKNHRARAFALLALGLLQVNGDDQAYDRVVETLRKLINSKDESSDNAPVCSLVAMGLSGDPSFIDDLLPMVRDGRAFKTTKLKDVVRSYAASALGKIISSIGTEFVTPQGNNLKNVVDVLSKAMINSDNHTVRSAVIAFGQIGSQAGVDAGTIKKMVRSLDYMVKKGEAQAANYALISLGKIGAEIEDTGIRNKIFDTLRTNLKKGTYVSKPFAALSLGLMGRSAKATDSRDAIKDLVRFEFREFRGDPKNRGGYAIALGMLRDRDAVPMLIEVLEDKGAVKRLRGACAVALGLIRDRRAIDAIKKALIEDKDPELRVDTAIAVGLIGDSESVKLLVDILKDPRSSLYVQGSVTLAVGRIGDKSAVGPLVKMLKDTGVQDLNRALAGVALGLLGDRQPIPVLSRISKDVNYRAMINAMEEVLSIL